jgi:hypothetical protein
MASYGNEFGLFLGKRGRLYSKLLSLTLIVLTL